MDGGAWMACAFKQIKSSPDYRVLHRRIVRLTARVTKRKIRKDETRNPALLDDILGRAKHHCGKSVRFKMPGDQTHGLVANWSQGN